MANNAIKRLQASQRKRAAYLSKYGMSTSNDIIMLELEKAIRKERVKQYRKHSKQQMRLII